MPLYPYKCDECAHTSEEFQHIRDEPLTECPVCKSAYKRTITTFGTGNKLFKKPIEMMSIALEEPGEIREFQRRNPDVKIETNEAHPLYGIPIAHSREEKMRILRAEGFQEKN